ncbi:MAG: VWA domain-containing protein [bacterium]|nr:VWA domain-containing protein [bacterium]
MKKIFYFFILIIIPGILFAKPGIDVLNLDTSSFPDISLNIALTGGTGESSTNKNEYIILFNNQPVDYSLHAQKVIPPTSTLVLIDASYSLREGKLQQIKSSAKRFIKKISEKDTCAVFIFHDTLEKKCDFTTDKNKLITCINNIRRNGKNTLLYNSAIEAIDFLSKDHVNTNKTILLYSDGYDQYSKYTVNNVIEKAKSLQIHIFTDGYTNTHHRHLKSLKQLASKTGGLYAYNSNIDLYKKMFSYKQDRLLQFSFEGENLQKNNHITLKNTKYNITKNIYFKSPDYTAANSSTNKKVQLKIILGIIVFSFLLLGIILIFKLPKKKYGFQKRITKTVPGLKEILDAFEDDIAEHEKDIIGIKTYDDSDSDFDLFADIFLNNKGKMNVEMNQILNAIFNLDSNKISKLIPFMIHVVKDSSGFEKDNNLNLLKEMAQNLNLSLDTENDINHLEEWWNKNKEKVNAEIKKQNENKSFEKFQKDENLLFYFIEDNNIREGTGSVVTANNEEFIVLSDSKILLDTILCFYRINANSNSTTVSLDDYYFLQLHEISKEKNKTYRLKSLRISSEQMENEDVKKIVNFLLVNKS